jgi:hypothetical protein
MAILRQLEGKMDWEAFENRCALMVKERVTSQSPHTLRGMIWRLKMDEFAIKPIQRVCHYPLLFDQLLRVSTDSEETSLLQKTIAMLKCITERVNDAKRKREIEVKTNLVRSRLEYPQDFNTGVIEHLGDLKLCGSLQLLYLNKPQHSVVKDLKIKYIGGFLFKESLVVCKIRKNKIYEVRHSIPLRIFALKDLKSDGEFFLALVCARSNSCFL